MKLSKKVFAVSAILLISSLVFAQEKETSVESEYLNDVDGDIIMTLADSDEYDNKLVAIQYLAAALDEGNTSEAVIQALDRLAGEGLTTQSRTNGRLSNNFPEIRREACKLMAKVPTEHSKNTLISIAVADNEPMVIAAAVKSLGEIGINENDEAVDAIAFANRRNQVLNPISPRDLTAAAITIGSLSATAIEINMFFECSVGTLAISLHASRRISGKLFIRRPFVRF